MPRIFVSCLLGIGALALAVSPASAQVRTMDPNEAIEADVAPPPADDAGYGADVDQQAATAPSTETIPADNAATAATAGQTADNSQTYQENDVLSAAEGVFGKGAEGLAKLIESILKDQGEPNAYIAGREVGGAIAIGLRYGSGTMFHKVEGERPVYWTGPSLGFDIGGNGAKTFVLVYNLYDSQELYKRYPAVEGTAYVIGGFTASYLRRGDVVLIPIRLGVGWRLGANVGYMKFTEKSSILPF